MENRSLHNVEILQAFHNVELISLQYVEKASEQVRGCGLILTLLQAPNSLGLNIL